MIVLDSSAVVAMLQDEPEAERFFDVVEKAERCCISAANALEASLVLYRRRGDAGASAVADFLAVCRAEVRPFDEALVPVALDAYRRFGKGTGAAAQLNFGDCIAYALAKSLDAPLLFKGYDFSATDVAACAD